MAAEWWALGISLLALITTLTRDFFVPLLFKPRMILIGKDDGECVENACDLIGHSSRWVRLKLINKNSFWSKPAKNCYVKLLSIHNSMGDAVKPFTPLPLPWVSYDDFEGKKHDLSIGEYHLIDLVNEYEKLRILRFKISIPLELIKQSDKKLSKGEYTFRVGVYGDNFKPIFKNFKIRLTEKYGELNFVK